MYIENKKVEMRYEKVRKTKKCTQDKRFKKEETKVQHYENKTVVETDESLSLSHSISLSPSISLSISISLSFSYFSYLLPSFLIFFPLLFSSLLFSSLLFSSHLNSHVISPHLIDGLFIHLSPVISDFNIVETILVENLSIHLPRK